jgi:hypothetical protein
MVGNLPKMEPDWEDFQTAVSKCPAKGFIVRDPGLALLEEEPPAKAEEPA